MEVHLRVRDRAGRGCRDREDPVSAQRRWRRAGVPSDPGHRGGCPPRGGGVRAAETAAGQPPAGSHRRPLGTRPDPFPSGSVPGHAVDQLLRGLLPAAPLSDGIQDRLAVQREGSPRGAGCERNSPPRPGILHRRLHTHPLPAWSASDGLCREGTRASRWDRHQFLAQTRGCTSAVGVPSRRLAS